MHPSRRASGRSSPESLTGRLVASPPTPLATFRRKSTCDASDESMSPPTSEHANGRAELLTQPPLEVVRIEGH